MLRLFLASAAVLQLSLATFSVVDETIGRYYLDARMNHEPAQPIRPGNLRSRSDPATCAADPTRQP
jgi:hypothetical protein